MKKLLGVILVIGSCTLQAQTIIGSSDAKKKETGLNLTSSTIENRELVLTEELLSDEPTACLQMSQTGAPNAVFQSFIKVRVTAKKYVVQVQTSAAGKTETMLGSMSDSVVYTANKEIAIGENAAPEGTYRMYEQKINDAAVTCELKRKNYIVLNGLKDTLPKFKLHNTGVGGW